MNKKIFIGAFLVGFLLLNILSIKSFYFNAYGNDLFEQKLFTGAINNFINANNIEGVFNEANSMYKQKKYTDAIKKYLSIESNNKSLLDFNINHNIGNLYYRIGEDEKDNNKKSQYWQKSVDSYKKALDITYDDQTKKNLEFVLDKIKNIKKDDNQDKTGSGTEKNKTSSGSQENTEGKTGTGSDQNGQSKDSKTGSGSENKNGKESKDGKQKSGTGGLNNNEQNKTNSGSQGDSKSQSGQQQPALSKDEQQAIKNYEESLKQNQKKSKDYFNKVYDNTNNSNDPFDAIFNDPFFNNDTLNGQSNKKDW